MYLIIYEELIQLNNKEKKQFLKCANDLNRHFSNENTQTVNKHIKKTFNITVLREISKYTHIYITESLLYKAEIKAAL